MSSMIYGIGITREQLTDCCAKFDPEYPSGFIAQNLWNASLVDDSNPKYNKRLGLVITDAMQAALDEARFQIDAISGHDTFQYALTDLNNTETIRVKIETGLIVAAERRRITGPRAELFNRSSMEYQLFVLTAPIPDSTADPELEDRMFLAKDKTVRACLDGEEEPGYGTLYADFYKSRASRETPSDVC